MVTLRMKAPLGDLAFFSTVATFGTPLDITVSELAQILKLPATEIVGFAFKNMGLMVTINQRLDFDQIELIAGEFDFQAVREDEYVAEETLATKDSIRRNTPSLI